MTSKKRNSNKGEMLVALLKAKSDFSILQEQGWYRIPVDKAPHRWPPRWLAFYQPKAFGDEAFQVRYYGEVKRIQVVKRSELFPNELPSVRSARPYYRIEFAGLTERNEPILSRRFRRLVFIPTTWNKFQLAEEINDLFDDSPLEDVLWGEFKKLKLTAERQFGVRIRERYFQIDFALFCRNGKIAVEADGDTWHINEVKAPQDMERDNFLQRDQWLTLHFGTRQILEEASTYCTNMILGSINSLGGLEDEKMVPRIFYPGADGVTQQLSLFDSGDNGYQVNEARPDESD